VQKRRFKFSTAVDRLEELVERLSTEELDLEDALNLFEEGIKLSVECLKKLEEAKGRIEFLIKESEEAFKRIEAEPEELAELGAQVADELSLDGEDGFDLDEDTDEEDGPDDEQENEEVVAAKKPRSRGRRAGSKRAHDLFEE